MTKKSRRGEIVAPTSYAAQIIRQQAAERRTERDREKAFEDMKAAVLEDMSRMFDGDQWDELHGEAKAQLDAAKTTHSVVLVVQDLFDSMSDAEAADFVLNAAFGR